MDKRRFQKTLVAGAGLTLAAVVGGCGSSAHRVAAPVAPATSATATTAAPASAPPPTTTVPAPARPPLTATTAAPPPSAPPTTRVTPPSTAAPEPSAPACPHNLAGSLAATYGAGQVITVDAPVYSTTIGTVTLWQREGRCWALAAGPWQGDLGYNGFSDSHHEGDGTTPTGAYGIGPVMYGVAPNPGVRYAYHRLVCGDWWDEDPSSPEYNTFQHVPCGQPPPFGGGSEALWQEGNAYPSFAVVNYNANPVIPGKGSAIFIHADVGGSTNGCVSLPLGELDTLLRWLNPSSSPLIVMGPDSEITRF